MQVSRLTAAGLLIANGIALWIAEKRKALRRYCMILNPSEQGTEVGGRGNGNCDVHAKPQQFSALRVPAAQGWSRCPRLDARVRCAAETLGPPNGLKT